MVTRPRATAPCVEMQTAVSNRAGGAGSWLAEAVLAASTVLCGCQRPDAPATAVTSTAVAQAPAEVERIVEACVTAMVQSTCQVVRDRSGAPPPEATVVFVAGVGPVDAAAYNAIRAAGEEMCNTVKAACLQSWEGSQCRTARSLWGTAPTTR